MSLMRACACVYTSKCDNGPKVNIFDILICRGGDGICQRQTSSATRFTQNCVAVHYRSILLSRDRGSCYHSGSVAFHSCMMERRVRQIESIYSLPFVEFHSVPVRMFCLFVPL